MLVKTEPDYPPTPKTIISLQNGLIALVDPELFEQLNAFHWHASQSFCCWYAVRWTTIDGKRKLIRMHRQVAETPEDLVCHHVNGNSLDNRKSNLMNVSEHYHAKLFSWR